MATEKVEAPEKWEIEIDDFLKFMGRTGSPHYAVLACEEMLRSAGYSRLYEEVSTWEVMPGGKYYVVRGGTTIGAFHVPPKTQNLRCVVSAAHSDSPALKVRPNSTIRKDGYLQLGVEVYGGGSWHTWFDRGLGLCGLVCVEKPGSKTVEERYVHINEPLLLIPNLAIHLKSADERAAFVVNAENHLRPLLCGFEEEIYAPVPEKEGKLQKRLPAPLIALLAKKLDIDPTQIIDVDLTLFDVTPARKCGMYSQWIESQRMDNHTSLWASFSAILEAKHTQSNEDTMFVALGWDHEEIGSQTAVGAASSITDTWLSRILDSISGPKPIYPSFIQRSFMLSVDGAHAFHPNYSDKYQVDHRPYVNMGVVLKWNANMRYTTNAKTAAICRQVAKEVKVPLQDFVVRNDSPCGSTIGPLASSRTGLPSIDVGCPMWAMHSIRESVGCFDLVYAKRLIKGFYQHFDEIAG